MTAAQMAALVADHEKRAVLQPTLARPLLLAGAIGFTLGVLACIALAMVAA